MLGEISWLQASLFWIVFALVNNYLWCCAESPMFGKFLCFSNKLFFSAATFIL
jgi:hypothetical protein